MSVKLAQGAEQAVTEEITKAMQTLHRRIIRDLSIAGEKAVEKARLIATKNGGGGGVLSPYTVQTGNLVSSVGYAMVQDGQIVTMSSFNAISGPEGDGQEGGNVAPYAAAAGHAAKIRQIVGDGTAVFHLIDPQIREELAVERPGIHLEAGRG